MLLRSCRPGKSPALTALFKHEQTQPHEAAEAVSRVPMPAITAATAALFADAPFAAVQTISTACEPNVWQSLVRTATANGPHSEKSAASASEAQQRVKGTDNASAVRKDSASVIPKTADDLKRRMQNMLPKVGSAAQEDPGRDFVRQEALEVLEARLKADRPALMADVRSKLRTHQRKSAAAPSHHKRHQRAGP